ncbi:hypothetical protein ACFOET_03810 [Parapedobacter deserti]|uniref:Uncharacterized protein n=1 Tax=Parapedobacter deserti TaxID=1912957 RepID=A0ABV7JI02_9SPHI
MANYTKKIQLKNLRALLSIQISPCGKAMSGLSPTSAAIANDNRATWVYRSKSRKKDKI